MLDNSTNAFHMERVKKEFFQEMYKKGKLPDTVTTEARDLYSHLKAAWTCAHVQFSRVQNGAPPPILVADKVIPPNWTSAFSWAGGYRYHLSYNA
eukprot:scaffold130991_cov21-Tisochrysis_lutea.AAC.2